MVDSVGQCDERSPRVPNDDRLINTEPRKSLPNERRLCRSCPDFLPRPVAVTEPGAIKRNYAVVSSQPVEQPADLEILDHALVTMKQYDGRIVKTHPINLN